MLRDDSPLTRLPASLNRRQVIYLDGIRHSAEIVSVAHARLRAALTAVARAHGQATPRPPTTFPSIFLDAWAIVDAVDRLRSLLLCMPGAIQDPPQDGERGFISATQSIRKLRNVADHLAQRVDYVIARDGTALGKLRWITLSAGPVDEVLSCTLVPGTMAPGHSPLVNPVGRKMRAETDMITLQAGEYEACLCDAVAECERVIRMIEDSLEVEIAARGLLGSQAGADMMAVVVLKLAVNAPDLPPNTGGEAAGA